MSIQLNKVDVEIDGKVYQLYKVTFGFQRRLLEAQTSFEKSKNDTAEKYNIPVDEVLTSPVVPPANKIALMKMSLDFQEIVAELFVNKDEAVILDKFDGDNISQLMASLV